MIRPTTPPVSTALDVPGMTQARLARLINVSRVTVARWKAGTRQPDNPTLLLLSIIGNVPPTSWPPQLKDRWEANLPKRRVVG